MLLGGLRFLPGFPGAADGDEASLGHCPFLRESLMQYCGAAPVAKFVPYSESLLSRCGNDSHRYCELYLRHGAPASRRPTDVDGIADARLAAATPPTTCGWTSREDGVCHAGIDAFLSRALGKVDRISYVWTKGRHRPTAVLTVAGVRSAKWSSRIELLLTNCNLYLRADPRGSTAEPYTGGWLFEGDAGRRRRVET